MSSNYPDNIYDSSHDPASPIYIGSQLDCGHKDIDNCSCYCQQCDKFILECRCEND